MMPSAIFRPVLRAILISSLLGLAAFADPPQKPRLNLKDIQQGIRQATARSADEEGRDDPVPPENEIVMTPGMKLTASTPIGDITITAGTGLRRCYTWEGATRCVHMWPRKERWYGSLGIYFPGPGDHWKEHNGITRGCVGEEQKHFQTHHEAVEWIEQQKKLNAEFADPVESPHAWIHRNDGLVVDWGKVPARNQLDVIVMQILIDGKKPTKLPGAEDDKIVVETPKEPR
jgi:hypothetical protein